MEPAVGILAHQRQRGDRVRIGQKPVQLRLDRGAGGGKVGGGQVAGQGHVIAEIAHDVGIAPAHEVFAPQRTQPVRLAAGDVVRVQRRAEAVERCHDLRREVGD